MIVGLTGGIGSGKSTVAKMFRELGVPVYDSDRAAKDLMVNSASLREQIVGLFGKAAYLDEKLNKTYIADIVFRDKKKLNALNSIVHPAVREDFAHWVEKQEALYVIQESALIFENDSEENYSMVILVTAPKETRIQRVIQRDTVTKQQVESRMDNQLPEEEKLVRADFIIENLDLRSTKERVIEIHKSIINAIPQK